MGGLIHVGAWHGLEYLNHEGSLLLFEPQGDAFRRLEANLGGSEHVKLFNVALGSKGGVAEMHKADPDHSSSLLAPIEARDRTTFNGETETVRVMTLDVVMRSQALVGLYDQLVVDTQGYELEVLKGARETLKDVKRIECEIHNPDVYPGAGSLEEIDDYLLPLGFVRVSVDRASSDDLADVVYEKGDG
jgi:FkbM family methyltransferase